MAVTDVIRGLNVPLSRQVFFLYVLTLSSTLHGCF